MSESMKIRDARDQPPTRRTRHHIVVKQNKADTQGQAIAKKSQRGRPSLRAERGRLPAAAACSIAAEHSVRAELSHLSCRALTTAAPRCRSSVRC